MVTAMAIAVVIIACYKIQKFDSSSDFVTPPQKMKPVTIAPTVPVFNKEVGRLVRKDTTLQWIKAYEDSFQTLNSFTLSTGRLAGLLAQKDCAGLMFYHALRNKTWIVLPVAIREDGATINADSVPIGEQYMTLAKADTFLQAYRSAYPGVEGHYFGSNFLRRFIHDIAVTTIRFQRGLNSKGEQLVLSNGDLNVHNGVYDGDASYVCPPVCR